MWAGLGFEKCLAWVHRLENFGSIGGGLRVAATRGPCWALLDVFARARRLGVASC